MCPAATRNSGGPAKVELKTSKQAHAHRPTPFNRLPASEAFRPVIRPGCGGCCWPSTASRTCQMLAPHTASPWSRIRDCPPPSWAWTRSTATRTGVRSSTSGLGLGTTSSRQLGSRFCGGARHHGRRGGGIAGQDQSKPECHTERDQPKHSRRGAHGKRNCGAGGQTGGNQRNTVRSQFDSGVNPIWNREFATNDGFDVLG